MSAEGTAVRRRARSRLAALTLVALFFTGCGGSSRSSPAAPTALAPHVRAYLDELIAVMEAHSLNRMKVDWAALRTSVFLTAGTAQSVEAALPAIQAALARLGDGHSFYRSASGRSVSGAARACNGTAVGTPLLPGSVGYIRVGRFSGSPAEAAVFANDLHRAIAAADRADLAGWVVDLRGNGGGNMWPMIAGVGPVLGEGRVGYFIHPLGTEIPWEYRDGASWEGERVAQRVDAPYRLRRNSPRVAVLIDGATASSGEAVAIAFQQRPAARTFGTLTCGLSTANEEYRLSDGASLFLTVSTMADRTKVQYGGVVVPDELIADVREAERRAAEWLLDGG